VVSAEENRVVVVSLGVVAAALAAVVVASAIAAAVSVEPTALERTVRCLRNEKGLQVTTPPRDPIAQTADRGALSTVVEGNPVTVMISSDPDGPLRLQRLYEDVVGDLGSRFDRRGEILYLFEGEPSPTQRQTLYDCAYS
jgi:hypothetical protein